MSLNQDLFLQEIKGQLIVSCQALPGEPLYGADHMAKMALAAKQGGAAAIRANSVTDILAIKAGQLHDRQSLIVFRKENLSEDKHVFL